MAEKVSKGKIIIQTDRGFFPFNELRKFEKKEDKAKRKGSSQARTDNKWLNEQGLIPHPYPARQLLQLYESVSVLFSTVNQVAQDVGGCAWNVVVREGKKENLAEYKRLMDFLKSPNDDASLRRILKTLVIDWGTVGWFALEGVRTRDQKIGELYQVPAHTIFVHKDREKYCQVRGQKKVWFKKWGIQKNFSRGDGKESEGGAEQANELIFYRAHYPLSDYYGVPNSISAIGDLLGLLGVRDYNLAFFENFGVPSAIVILEGDWEAGSDKKVTQFLNSSLSGTDNAHKSLVVMQPDNAKFTYKPLTAEVNGRDQSFKLYEANRRDSILTAYSMPPERVGVRIVGKLGGNVAEESTKVYIAGVIEPLKRDLEEIINDRILQSEVYEFKFEESDIRDEQADTSRLEGMIEHGMVSPNEARRELGYDEYDGGDRYFIMSSLVEIGGPVPDDEEGIEEEEETEPAEVDTEEEEENVAPTKA